MCNPVWKLDTVWPLTVICQPFAAAPAHTVATFDLLPPSLFRLMRLFSHPIGDYWTVKALLLNPYLHHGKHESLRMCVCVCLGGGGVGVHTHFLLAVMVAMVHVKRCSRRNEASKNAEGLCLHKPVCLCQNTSYKNTTSITCLYGVLYCRGMPEHLQYVSETQLERCNTIPP